jgi:diguanylate cyclase (GGDEF)-like protein
MILANLGRDFLPVPLYALFNSGFALAALLCFLSASLRILDGRPPLRRWLVLGGLSLAIVFGLALAGLPRPPRALVFSLAGTLLCLDGARVYRAQTRAIQLREGPGIFLATYAIASLGFLVRSLYYALATFFPDLAIQDSLVDAFSTMFHLFIFTASDLGLIIILMTRTEREFVGKVMEAGNRSNELQILYDAFSETAGTLSLDELLPRVLDFIERRLGANAAAIFLRPFEGEDLVLLGQRGLDEREISLLFHPDPETSVAGRAYHGGRPVISDLMDWVDPDLRSISASRGLNAVAGFPLDDGRPGQGSLTVAFRDAAALDEAKVSMLTTFALQVGIMVRSANLHAKLTRANSRLRELASTDALTGIANRRAAIQALDRELALARRTGSQVVTIMIDIDHFKQFNDLNGHECGDFVLARTAAIIADTVRATDTASRWGGEEFLVILGDTGEEGAVGLGERIRRSVEAAIWDYEGKRLSVTVTVGVAVSPPEAGGDAVIALADAALYEGKRNGRNRVALCSATTGVALPEEAGEIETLPFADNPKGRDGGILDLEPLD